MPRAVFEASEADRAAKLRAIEEQGRQLRELERVANSDRANHLEQIAELSGLLHEANADQPSASQTARRSPRHWKNANERQAPIASKHLEQVNELSGLLNEANADRAHRLKDSQTLTEALEERERVASAYRSKHLEQVNELSGLLTKPMRIEPSG